MIWKELDRSRRALRRFIFVGVLLAGVAWLLPPTILGDRIKVASLGAAVVALGAMRPSGAWDAPRGQGLRWLLGDKGAQFLLVALGLAWVAAALLGLI